MTAVPFKGPVLADTAYGNIALRQFDDLDLLVPVQDVFRAKELLQSRGYRSSERVELRTLLSWPAVSNLPLTRDRDGSTVEVHWNVAPRSYCFALTSSLLLAGVQPTRFLDGELAAFSPEHTILVLCVHASKHGWDRLGMLLDLDRFIRSAAHVDWQLVCNQAERLGGTRMLGFALQATRDWLATPIPSAACERALRDPSLPSLNREYARRLRLSFEPLGTAHRPPHWTLYMRLRERWRDRFGYAWFSLTSPTARETEIVRLPAALLGLYYPVRVVRLIAKYVVRLPISLRRQRTSNDGEVT